MSKQQYARRTWIACLVGMLIIMAIAIMRGPAIEVPNTSIHVHSDARYRLMIGYKDRWLFLWRTTGDVFVPSDGYMAPLTTEYVLGAINPF